MAAKRALRSLARHVQALDLELDELLKDLDQPTQAVCPAMRQTYGIGVDGAVILLTAGGDNPERMRSEASFAALCQPVPGILVAIGSTVEATARPMRLCTVLLSLG